MGEEKLEKLTVDPLILFYHPDELDRFELARENQGPAIWMTHIEGLNLITELQRLTAGPIKENQRVVISSIEKPRKVTRPTR